MRTTIRIFAAAAAAAIGLLTSCQEQELDIPGTEVLAGKELVPVTLNASIVGAKVTYTETESKDLQPSWVDGDTVIGFDEDNKSYEFIVYTISADGKAQLIGKAPANCTLHLVYLGSATPAVTEGLTLPISVEYDGQVGDKNIPAVMLADGDVVKGKGEFHFRNAGAIVSISAVKGIPLGSNVSKITVSGANLSAATIALSDGALALTATEKADDAISVGDLGFTLNDANGILSAPVFLAVPPGAVIAKVSVALAKEPETIKRPSETPQEGVDYVTIAGIKWAKWNVGVSESSEHPEVDFGWYFYWGGTEGYFRYKDTWQAAKAPYVEFSYSPDSAYTVVASDYVYVKDQTFAGNLFNWTGTPYHIGSEQYTGWTKYVPADKSSYWWPAGGTPDNKTTLDPEDDAARANWGGNWRMPTSTEITALKNNTTSEWKENYNGTGINGRLLTSTVAGEEGHSIFIPAAGYGGDDELKHTGTIGNYWAISVTSSDPSNASGLFSSSDATVHSAESQRYHGFPVRPVLEPEITDVDSNAIPDYNGHSL